jgi:hypothetical protein
LLAAAEVAVIFGILFLFAGSPPPDVGESHYLVKAKHYWQPEWCAGDLFLESRDAHATFYWTFGWVTKFCSLTATAWIGRAITWLLLAWSWRRLSWAVASWPYASVLSAGLLLLFLRNFHLAGEWIVGGVEAKGFAYVLVFLALEAIVKDRWRGALLFAGAAGAFHVLVGGWTTVAIGLAWVMSRGSRPPLISLLPAAAGGLVLSLPGLLPAVALNWGVSADVNREAARIYVFERLAHHLVFHRFDAWQQVSYGALVAGWAALAWWTSKERGLRRLNLVTGSALTIALIGLVIDQAAVLYTNVGGGSFDEYALRAAPWLRYYFFRMSDSLVPIAVSLGIVHGLWRLWPTRRNVAICLGLVASYFAASNVARAYYWHSSRQLPGAISQPLPTSDAAPRYSSNGWPAGEPEVPRDALQWWSDWQKACKWISANTRADAKFITPRHQQTFKWYAGRAEVANWKDIPQDASNIVIWRKILSELYPNDMEHRRHDLAAFSDEELIALGRKYGASYIVVDRTRAHRSIELPQLYPFSPEDNPSFEVYRVPDSSAP